MDAVTFEIDSQLKQTSYPLMRACNLGQPTARGAVGFGGQSAGLEAAKSRTGGRRGGAEDGGRSGRPRWLRIRRATARSVMEAMT